jgi:PAS domain S-box-containing protein
MIPSNAAKIRASGSDFFTNEDLYSELYDELFIGYFSARADGVLLSVNSTLLKWTGRAREEFVEKMRWQDIFSIGGRMYCETHVTPLLQMQDFVKEIALDIAGKDGEKIPILLQASLSRNAAGEPEVVRGALIEATERRAYERELSLAKSRAEDLAARLGEAERELREFMDMVVHDLRNPLHSLLMSFEILKIENECENAAQKRQNVIAGAYQTVEQMRETLEHLQSLNALEQGGFQIFPTPCNLREIMETIMAQYASHAEAKNIALRLDVPGCDMNWHTDKNLFRQIVSNFVSNAVKYSPTGKNVFVRAQISDERVRVEVEDEGYGISAEDMTKLFGKFAKLSARPTGGESSTGLGLSIVKKTVEAMNGRVWCESELGKGATFIVELPVA